MKTEVKIHTFLTHKLPHLDEIFSYWMLTKFWAEKCCKNVKIRFWDPEGADAGTQLQEVMQDKGVLTCGIPGGDLDEHPNGKTMRKDGECAATLAAKKFGVFEKPELQRLLEYVKRNDLDAHGSAFDLAAGIRVMYKSNPNPMVGIKWALQTISPFYAEQEEFQAGLEEFKRNAVIEEIIAGGKKVKMATIESDNGSINRCSRFLDVAILIQKTSSGNIQIHTNKRFELPPFDDVARMLRTAEQEAKGLPITHDWFTLAQDGEVEGAEEWYYLRRGNLLLNGSLTTAKPPTKIPLPRVAKAVKIAMDSSLFEPDRSTGCRMGMCIATIADPCPWYPLGLGRCQTIRRDARD